jgi:hypothetical protein
VPVVSQQVWVGKSVIVDRGCHDQTHNGHYEVMLATKSQDKQEDFCRTKAPSQSTSE